ncbi:MAG: aldo/keto reductase [Candidatus Poribacteria bacterium]|nr:aldo/keto reductase [Candidatus Poribacteria bacterium]
MQYRTLGKTGLKVSALGFGCGAVGGLLVKGEYQKMVRAVARAVDLGVNYFDTARIYGDGQSETNLGLVLEELAPDVVVGTKVRLTGEDMQHIERAVVDSVEGSLTRLRRERLDLIQLHNGVGFRSQPDRGVVGIDDLEPVMHTFQSLAEQGKVRFWGINGLGDTEALHQAVSIGGAQTVQTCYNLINPTAGTRVPEGFPFQNYGQLIDLAADNQMGVIAIRVLAAGALSGTPHRHPVAMPSVSPIASGGDYAEDVERSKAFAFLIDEGYTSNLVEAAIRFAISKAEISTALVGVSSLEQLEQAVECAQKGPLSSEALSRLHDIWALARDWGAGN